MPRKPAAPLPLLDTLEPVLAVDPAAAKPSWSGLFVRKRLVALFRGDEQIAPAAVDGATHYARASAVRVAIEDQYAGRNGGSVIGLAQAAGHYAGMLGFLLPDVAWFPPSQWKRALCPMRKTSKQGLKEIVYYPVYQRLSEILDPEEWALIDAAFDRYSGVQTRTDICDSVGIGIVAFGRQANDK